jgi:hypothetical protein
MVYRNLVMWMELVHVKTKQEIESLKEGIREEKKRGEWIDKGIVGLLK